MSSGGISFGAVTRSLRMSVAGAGTPADDDDVLDDERPAAPAPAGDRALEAFRQIDLAVVAEVGVALAGLGVQRDEVAADVGDDARVLAVGPVGEAARRRRRARVPGRRAAAAACRTRRSCRWSGRARSTAPTAVLM